MFCINSIKAFAEADTKYLKVNNTTLEFNEIIYVDGTNGDDITGKGSIENPYKTIIKGQSVAVDGDAIYIKEKRPKNNDKSFAVFSYLNIRF